MTPEKLRRHLARADRVAVDQIIHESRYRPPGAGRRPVRPRDEVYAAAVQLFRAGETTAQVALILGMNGCVAKQVHAIVAAGLVDGTWREIPAPRNRRAV